MKKIINPIYGKMATAVFRIITMKRIMIRYHENMEVSNGENYCNVFFGAGVAERIVY